MNRASKVSLLLFNIYIHIYIHTYIQDAILTMAIIQSNKGYLFVRTVILNNIQIGY
jgi:hypothetical protein